MKKVLTIAGSDPIGGAGMQADLKTFTAHDVYGMTAITLLSVQNSLRFTSKLETTPEYLAEQIDAIFEDVFPDAMKTGMLPSSELIKVVAEKIRQYKPKNVVIDPVMVAHRTIKLIEDEAVKTMIEDLIPLADVITPNLGEAEIISGIKIESKEDMLKAGKLLFERFEVPVMLKGGITNEDSDDLYVDSDGFEWICAERLDTIDVRGTGCSLSAAITSNLAKGQSVKEACVNAKKYVYEGLKSVVKITKGKGPIHHSFRLRNLDI